MLQPKRSADLSRGFDVRDSSIATYYDPLDALWRFAPAPHSATVRIGAFLVRIESNDVGLLTKLPRILPREAEKPECVFLWKIIRDLEIAGEIGPASILADGKLKFLRMGHGVFAGVDADQKELLGFVGACVNDRSFHEIAVPLFAQLTLDALEGARRFGAEAADAELALTRGNSNA
jgi:hypothetical protein